MSFIPTRAEFRIPIGAVLGWDSGGKRMGTNANEETIEVRFQCTMQQNTCSDLIRSFAFICRPEKILSIIISSKVSLVSLLDFDINK